MVDYLQLIMGFKLIILRKQGQSLYNIIYLVMTKNIKMRKLKFNKLKHGRELLIDAVDMNDFEPNADSTSVNFYMIGCLKKVTGKIKVNHHVLNLEDHSFVFMQPGATSALHNALIREATWIIFEGEFLDFFFNDQFFTYKFDFFHGVNKHYLLYLDKEAFDNVYPLTREILKEVKNLQPDSEHLLRSSLYLLLIKLNRHYGNIYKTSGVLISDKRVLKLKHLLENNIREYQTVEKYATLLNISKPHLNKLSHTFFGRTPKELINDRLMMEARQEILFTDKDISEIAYDLNFSNPANFNRFFKKAANQTPAQFRAGFSK